MNQITAKGIILGRTDFGEADRILTLLTPERGKLRLMAKGVRRIKSKLAGGIELFSISDITFIKGRGDIGTLVSTRLAKHYRHIVEDIDRTMLGYELIKQLDKVTEDEPEPAYFHLLQRAFEALDDADVNVELIKLWFATQLLRLAGHSPNLQTEQTGAKLDADKTYAFDFDHMAFAPNGAYSADHIKFLRLLFGQHTPAVLQKVQGSTELARALTPMVGTMLAAQLRI